MTLNNKRLGLELPGKEEVVAMLFPLESKKVASKRRLPTEMMRLLLKLNAYPKTKLANQATDMRTRINKLGPMLGHLNRLYNQRQALIRSSGLNEDGLKFYRNWVTMRKGYLETLLDYKTNPKRRRKLRILMAMCTHSYNFVRVFQKDSDKLKYVQVTGFKAFEKIDPLHRKDVAMQTRVGEGFSNSLKERYELWINAEVNRHKDPSDPDTLIDFFISIDDKPMDRTGYFSKGQDALAEVTFQTRLARARYVWCGADGKRKLCRYNPKGYPVAKRMVYRGYHTLATPVGQTGRQVTYATGSNRVVHQDPDLLTSDYYVMRKNKLYTFPSAYARNGNPVGDIAHTVVIHGKAVAAAGMLAADNGKIVILDNHSGHYQPDYHLLRQVVVLLRDKKVLADYAMVGVWFPVREDLAYYATTTSGERHVTYTGYTLFLPVTAFLGLSETNFPINDTINVVFGHKSRFPKILPPEPKYESVLAAFYRVHGKYPWNQALLNFLAYVRPEIYTLIDRLRKMYAPRAKRLTFASYRTATRRKTIGRGAIHTVDEDFKLYDEMFATVKKKVAQPLASGSQRFNTLSIIFKMISQAEKAIKTIDRYVRHPEYKRSAKRRPVVDRLRQQLRTEIKTFTALRTHDAVLRLTHLIMARS